MPLLLNQLAPLPWAIAGAAIAALTLALLLFDSRRWRFPFLLGLLLGGFLSAVLGGGWEPTWALGRLDAAAALGTGAKIGWMFAAGLFIGFGTRLAGRCTSGHGIFGLSNFELPSLVTTVSFMLGGILTTQLIYRVVFA